MNRLRVVRRCAVAALAVGALAIPGAEAAVPQHDSASSGSLALAVDRQDYVTSATTTNPVDGSTIDPYDADPSSIHVAVAGGQEYAESFVHIAMDYLPAGSQASDAVLTLHKTAQSDASNTGSYPIYNVNESSAIIEACALTTELPQNFDSSKPPKYDCQHASAIGKPNKAGDTWTIDLRDLVAYWNAHGNTGAALIPIGTATPNDNWAVAFYKSRTSAVVDYVDAGSPSPKGHGHGHRHGATTSDGGGTTGSGGSAPTTASGPTSGFGGSAPSAGSAGNAGPLPTLGGPKTGTAPLGSSVQSPSVAGSTAAQPAAPGSTAGSATAGDASGPTSWWPWVLAGSLLVALGALAVAHRAQVAALARRWWPTGVAAYRTHPRAYAVAAAAVAWGLVFTSYSLVEQPAPATTPAADALPGPLASPSGTAPVAPGVPAGGSPALSGHAAGTAPSTGGAAATGPVVGQPASATSTGPTSSSSGAAPANNSEQQAAATEFNGKGHWQTINGIPVFFPADGSAPVAKLYSGADDTIGLTPDSLRLCGHAALTYGKAFNIAAKDLNVFWRSVNDHGGIYGRKVVTKFTNDNYDPGTAVQAAQQCKDWNTFLLLGGIGFDQIPAVRQWAEQNHELYLHHIATIQGSQGLRYSFSALPTVEQVGTWFGELAAQKFAGQKIGILYRQSSNWDPAVDTFKAAVAAANNGTSVVASEGVTINQANYTQQLVQLRNAGATVVFAWENALATIEMIQQAQDQNWHPAWLINGFNIVTNTLDENHSATAQDMWGIAEWDPYDPGYYGGGFRSYASYIHLFEQQYKRYDSKADLTGDGGDLLFLNWESQRWLYDLFKACGPDCTRNKIAGLLLAGYNRTTPPNCNADFGRTDDHHHGGYQFSVIHAIRDPNGRANFVPVQRCLTSL